MRKAIVAAILIALGTSVYAAAGVGFGVSIGYKSYPRYHGWYRYSPYYPYYRHWPGYYWWYPAYPAYGYYDPMVEIRCEVKPKETSVLVDGYYAGVVDDFDGFFQRLRVTPGKHTITFRHPGFQPYSISLYAVQGQDLHVKYAMVAGEDRMAEDQRLRQSGGTGQVVPREQAPGMQPPESQQPSQYRPPETAPTTPAPQAPVERKIAGQGLVQLNVNPPGASVYVDGNFWGVVQEAGEVEFRLSVGTHRVDVVKPGYQASHQEISVTEDRETVLTIALVAEKKSL
ncbi:MAG: PEGA domain-containing protein [Acidobacteriota bacterium]